MMMNHLLFRLPLLRLLPSLVLAFTGLGALAQTDSTQTDPPGRVASLSLVEGSVVFAPSGDTEWTDAQVNRPITRGDRVWTDPGARAELHLGSAVVHMNAQTFVDVKALDDQVFQASLNEGTVNARVRQLEANENFEFDTPQLAFRASQPGDYRIDVDPAAGTTRVIVHGGAALVYGASGQMLQLQAGEQMAFAGRDLQEAAVQSAPPDDGFDRWASDRNRREDESTAARYLPRDVVGYPQLDFYGTWAQDQSYGVVWYPTVSIADWAPYRYGHWDWIAPWGWTWIDDAPWGFAPFHYGRWATIGSRWAWVPGKIGRHPWYASALVGFVGGGHDGAGASLFIGSHPGIAWFPLAPGEAWRPFHHASPAYWRNVNRNIVNGGRNSAFIHQRRPEALTALRVDDFSRGRPVNRHRTRLDPAQLARLQAITQPFLPEPRQGGRGHPASAAAQPRPLTQTPLREPIIMGRTQPQLQSHESRIEQRDTNRRPSFSVPRMESRRLIRPQDEQQRRQLQVQGQRAAPEQRHQELQRQHAFPLRYPHVPAPVLTAPAVQPAPPFHPHRGEGHERADKHDRSAPDGSRSEDGGLGRGHMRR